MEDLIQHFTESPVIASFVIGLLLLIGAITKGGISLGTFEIPAIEAERAKYLGTLGFACIILAFFLAWKPWEYNNKPKADDISKDLIKGDTWSIPMLDLVEDIDMTDKLKITIVSDAKLGSTTFRNSKIKYLANEVGNDLITYQVSDGNGGRDTGEIKIMVEAPPPIMVNKRGKLVNIYGKPKKGDYKIDLDNKIEVPAVKLIIANDEGEFDLKTTDKKKRCKIFIQEKPTDFYLDYKEKIKLIEYNPIDSIAITFCKDYEKTETIRRPINPFKDRYNISFNELTKDSVATYEYGVLHLGIKYFGSNKIEEKGKLDFNFIQINRDKTVYDPVKITSGSLAANTEGWNSNAAKRLLRGEYELEIKSQNGTLLKTIDFTIK